MFIREVGILFFDFGVENLYIFLLLIRLLCFNYFFNLCFQPLLFFHFFFIVDCSRFLLLLFIVF
jgi:hypothetical protein